MTSDENERPTPEQAREMQEALGPLAERHGLPPPRPGTAPQIYIGQGTDVREVAMQLGQVCQDHGRGLFLSDEELVTIDRERGVARIMDEDTFLSWIADHVLIGSKWDKASGKLVKCSLPIAQSRCILKSHHFRAKLPRLVAVNAVKQPVRRRDGRVVLLPQGYDPESRIYTLEGGIDYAEETGIEEAVGFWRSLFGTFPWTDPRSLGVHTSAALTLFCQNMLPPGTLTPMFLYNANMSGSGKSALVSVLLWAIYGAAETLGIPEGDDEFKKELDTCAQALSPYAFFDDQAGYIENRRLNAWVTSRRWAGRVLGTHRKFSMPKRAVTIMTGNGVRLSADLGRRSVLADLFSKQSLKDRVLPVETIYLTDRWMEDEGNRSRVLSALWAMVKYSCVPREVEIMGEGDVVEKVTVCGRVEEGTLKRVRPSNPALDTFETWSEVVPQMVVDAGFSDPLERPDLPDTGDTGEREMDLLMKAVIRKHLWRRGDVHYIDPTTGRAEVLDGEGEEMPLPHARVELSDMVAMARRLGLFSEILETTDLVLVDMERARKGAGFWEEEFESHDLLKKKETRMPESAGEKRGQAERWYDKSMANKFSSRFKGKLGQYFTGECGGLYQLGERVSTRVSTWMVKRV